MAWDVTPLSLGWQIPTVELIKINQLVRAHDPYSEWLQAQNIYDTYICVCLFISTKEEWSKSTMVHIWLAVSNLLNNGGDFYVKVPEYDLGGQ